MTVSLMALYKRPNDADAFIQHYENTHLPLVKKIPNLREIKVQRVTDLLAGKSGYYLIVEMQFEDRVRFDEAMASPENRAAGKDLMSFAQELVTLLVVEA